MARVNCRIYSRDLLEPGHEITGPAIIEQLDTTTVIHPEQEATVDEYKNLIIREKAKAQEPIERLERNLNVLNLAR